MSVKKNREWVARAADPCPAWSPTNLLWYDADTQWLIGTDGNRMHIAPYGAKRQASHKSRGRAGMLMTLTGRKLHNHRSAVFPPWTSVWRPDWPLAAPAGAIKFEWDPATDYRDVITVAGCYRYLARFVYDVISNEPEPAALHMPHPTIDQAGVFFSTRGVAVVMQADAITPNEWTNAVMVSSSTA